MCARGVSAYINAEVLQIFYVWGNFPHALMLMWQQISGYLQQVIAWWSFFFFSATSFRVITANPGMLSATLFMQLKLISSTHSRSKHLCWVLHIPSFCWDVLQVLTSFSVSTWRTSHRLIRLTIMEEKLIMLENMQLIWNNKFLGTFREWSWKSLTRHRQIIALYSCNQKCEPPLTDEIF